MIYLLKGYNNMWMSNKFSDICWQTIVIPIPKNGKFSMTTDNYHTVGLTSHLCRTMECMISNRLAWFLESNRLLTYLQSGFCIKKRNYRPSSSSWDLYKESFYKKEHLTIFWSGKSIWIILKVWHYKWST